MLSNASEPIDDRKLGWIIFQSIVAAVFTVVTITGNALVCVAIIKNRALQSLTSVFIGNLAFVDLLVGLTLMPFAMVSCITYEWIFGDAFCQVCGFLNFILPLASIFTLAAVAFDRCIAISKPLHYHKWITRRTVGLFLVWIWAQSFFISISPFFSCGVYEFKQSQSLCLIKWEASQKLAIATLALGFVMPFTIMIVCYCCIFTIARRHNAEVSKQEKMEIRLSRQETYTQQRTSRVSGNEGNDDVIKSRSSDSSKSVSSRPSRRIMLAFQSTAAERKSFRREQKASVILFIVLGTFIVAWIPYIIGAMYLVFESGLNPWPDDFYTASVWIAMLQSSCNPFIYGMLDRRYRNAMFNILCCMKSKYPLDVTGLY